ncbi:hypothetical protein C8Q74DRAFT_312919 [Fomes fomentarius]|nr:hypothetical protein C8Q74DRAFT_312919 [Fomes fomentarius]
MPRSMHWIVGPGVSTGQMRCSRRQISSSRRRVQLDESVGDHKWNPKTPLLKDEQASVDGRRGRQLPLIPSPHRPPAIGPVHQYISISVYTHLCPLPARRPRIPYAPRPRARIRPFLHPSSPYPTMRCLSTFLAVALLAIQVQGRDLVGVVLEDLERLHLKRQDVTLTFTDTLSFPTTGSSASLTSSDSQSHSSKTSSNGHESTSSGSSSSSSSGSDSSSISHSASQSSTSASLKTTSTTSVRTQNLSPSSLPCPVSPGLRCVSLTILISVVSHHSPLRRQARPLPLARPRPRAAAR